MPYSPSLPFAANGARYVVKIRMVEGAQYYGAVTIPGTLLLEYCKNFGEVKTILKREAARLQRGAAKGNGFGFDYIRKPSQWCVGAVNTSCRLRRTEYHVARLSNGAITHVVSVVAL